MKKVYLAEVEFSYKNESKDYSRVARFKKAFNSKKKRTTFLEKELENRKINLEDVLGDFYQEGDTFEFLGGVLLEELEIE